MRPKGLLKDNEFFRLDNRSLLVFVLMFSSLLVLITEFVLPGVTYFTVVKAFVQPSVERQFRFHGQRKKIFYHDVEYTVFVIDSVEPGSLFDKAGFEADDVPIYSGGCEICYIHQYNVSNFYEKISAGRKGDELIFTVVKYDDVRCLESAERNGLTQRKIVLRIE